MTFEEIQQIIQQMLAVQRPALVLESILNSGSSNHNLGTSTGIREGVVMI